MVLRVQEGMVFRVQEGSVLRVQEGVVLRVQEGTVLRVQEGMVFRVQEGLVLRVQEGTVLKVQEGARGLQGSRRHVRSSRFKKARALFRVQEGAVFKVQEGTCGLQGSRRRGLQGSRRHVRSSGFKKAWSSGFKKARSSGFKKARVVFRVQEGTCGLQGSRRRGLQGSRRHVRSSGFKKAWSSGFKKARSSGFKKARVVFRVQEGTCGLQGSRRHVRSSGFKKARPSGFKKARSSGFKKTLVLREVPALRSGREELRVLPSPLRLRARASDLLKVRGGDTGAAQTRRGVYTGTCGREYHFVKQELSWSEAQTFCRVHHQDLATITALEEASTLHRDHNYTGLAWIGLHDVWRWTSTGETLGHYTNWKTSAPPDPSPCIAIDSADVKWFGHTCSHEHTFLCYTAGTPKRYHFIETTKTWDDAVLYCRSHYTDLAMIQSGSESTSVSSLLSSKSEPCIWIGLHKEWSDGTGLGFTNWEDDSDGNQCAAEGPDHRWFSQGCGQRLPFFCQGARIKKSLRVKMTFGSCLDLLDESKMKMMLQQMEEALRLKGVTNVTISTRSVRVKTMDLNLPPKPTVSEHCPVWNMGPQLGQEPEDCGNNSITGDPDCSGL
uniref:C-type lectin domain-containing protein n=1 Tax=Knipowitschia caucasica TaxID=637954 RepID=A0AAV2LXI0_KNICA